MKGQRRSRVSEMILQLLSELIRGKLKDPRIGFTTVTKVDVSPDLSNCRVFVTTLGDEQAQQESLDGLRSASGFLRRELAQQLALRKVPELHFSEDKELHRAEHIFEIMAKLKRERKEPEDG